MATNENQVSHTPGPWSVTLSRVGWGKWNRIFSAEITASDGTVVALISDINVQQQHLPACKEADAVLMADSTHLLAILQELVWAVDERHGRQCSPETKRDMEPVTRRARAMLKKHGEPPFPFLNYVVDDADKGSI